MTSTSPPGVPDSSVADTTVELPTVLVAVTVVEGVDPAASLDAVGRQVYEAQSVVVIGGGQAAAAAASDRGYHRSPDLETLVTNLGPEVHYVWILHGDAEPRPDALGALVTEAQRHDASLVGSKLLLTGSRDTLEGVGSATDVFGEPYTGLDEGEVDLEQYDVVRDVAFVSSVSVLVRRDLVRGLKGLDPTMPPVAAGLDFSQRVRIAGGRVMVVPSSEVFHSRRCGPGDGGWREQAGRLRAMLKAYRPVTLAWVVPFAFFAGVLDSLGSLLLGRWRVAARQGATWAWNLAFLVSTLAARGPLRQVRQVGDEELFRYQVRGSVRLRQVGSELSDRVLGMFDEDRTLARRATKAWESPTFWASIAVMAVVVVGVRAVFLGSLPVVGHALPLEPSPWTALSRYLGGPNSAGLGTAGPVHPSVGASAIVQAVLGSHPGLARSVITVAGFAAGIFGTGRLANRLGVGGPGGYLAGLVLMFGPAATVLAGDGRWSALIACGILPWAISAVLGPDRVELRRRLGDWGGAVVGVAATAAFAPLAGFVPFAFAVAWRFVADRGVSLRRAGVGLLGMVVALPYLMGETAWFVAGIPIATEVAVGAWVALVVAVGAAWLAGAGQPVIVAGLLTFTGLVAAKLGGEEVQLAGLVTASMGAALVAAVAISRAERRLVGVASLAAGVALVVLSLPGVVEGRAGLPSDQWGDRLDFASSLDEEGDPGRVLLVAPTLDALPGDARSGPGFWYRTVDSTGITLDQAELGPASTPDAALAGAIDELVSGSTLRPGAALAPFGVRWVVAVDGAALELAPLLDGQVDLNPLPLDPTSVVYRNTARISPEPRAPEPSEDPVAQVLTISGLLVVAAGLAAVLWARGARP